MPGIRGTGGTFDGTADSTGLVTTAGVCSFNRLRVANAGAGGAAITEGNTVTIGADVYEFRSSSPPTGGTAGRIWVYNDTTAALSRRWLVDSINGVVNIAHTTRTAQDASAGTNTQLVTAAGFNLATPTFFRVFSSTTIGGGIPTALGTVINCSETLSDAGDIWDSGTFYGYDFPAGLNLKLAGYSIQISTQMIAKGTMQVVFPFDVWSVVLQNINTPNQNETISTASGGVVTLQLAGGASPNNQVGDYINILAFGQET